MTLHAVSNLVSPPCDGDARTDLSLHLPQLSKASE